MKSIIRVKNLGKQYRIGARQETYATLRDTIAGAVRSPLNAFRRNGHAIDNTIWALKDVSFDVRPGEVVGIIGRNGAGKSTLLKVLSGITEPTTGEVDIYGRVGSLLEVGTGFHPELTGRENIYLNGSILGMMRKELERKFDEIVTFAEVDKFIDTPVKRYSSGMYVRLAFAVAAHLEPEILIVDEVLAVGDTAFQKKCLGKMGNVARAGRTVLFVSHNMAAVEKLCQRGIVLTQGKVSYDGSQTGAIAHYLTNAVRLAESLSGRTDRLGSGELRVTEITFRDMSGKRLDTLIAGQDTDIYMHYETTAKFRGSGIVASIIVRTQMDVPVFLQHNRLTGVLWEAVPAQGAFVCRIRNLPLPPAAYYLGFTIVRHGVSMDGLSEAVEMTVAEGDFFGSGEVPPISHGVCLVNAEWRLEG